VSKIQVPKKIRTEDFDSEDQEMIGKLAFSFNSFSDEVYQQLNGALDYDNLNRQVVVLTVTMDKNGKVTQSPTIKVQLNGRIRGVQVLNAVNVNNIGVYPTGAPFVSWSLNSNLLTILNITGLQASSQYQLTLELIV
jgi:hypothetical protein